VRAVTGGAPVRLGLDAVAGTATARLAACVADGGTVCNYGVMSGADPVMGRGELIYRGLSLTGFMLGRFMARRTLPQIRDIYADLGNQLLDGRLSAPVEKVFAIEDIKAALRRAQQGERSGKILVAPNGPV
jgi:NADPH:quinone reductase-like Zn-dependent oxidoreductase